MRLAGAELLEEERNIPLKLRRRGDLGGESWWLLAEGGYGKMVLGEPGLVWVRGGADKGLGGRLLEHLTKRPLVGLAE